MKTYTLCIVMFQAVIEPLVVAEVEPLLLQLPLQVPVSLGNEAEVRMRSLDGRNHFTPILGWRPLPGAAAPPGLRMVQERARLPATQPPPTPQYQDRSVPPPRRGRARRNPVSSD